MGKAGKERGEGRGCENRRRKLKNASKGKEWKSEVKGMTRHEVDLHRSIEGCMREFTIKGCRRGESVSPKGEGESVSSKGEGKSPASKGTVRVHH